MRVPVNGNENLNTKSQGQKHHGSALPRHRPIEPTESFEPGFIHIVPFLLLRRLPSAQISPVPNRHAERDYMNKAWFKRFGWLYWPMSWQGAAVVLLALAFCIQVFVAIDRHSHSASDTLYGV